MNKTFFGDGIDTAWHNALEALVNYPEFTSSPREMPIKELINTTIVVKNPRKRILTFEERKLSLRYLAGEVAFYLSGSRDLKFISHYSKFWNRVSDDGKVVNSCYGYKLFKVLTKGLSQFEYAKQQLLEDPNTRRAVMVIYTGDNAILNSKDNPCTMYVQFFIRNWHLYCITNIRSNDIWYGVSYDIPFFTIIQELMLNHLKKADYDLFGSLELGSFILNSGSLHLYEKDFKQAQRALINPHRFPYKEEMAPMEISSVQLIETYLDIERRYRLRGEVMQSSNLLNDKFLSQLRDFLLEEKSE